jgi:flagellar motility protein MotE (MotC chaperone)
MIFQRSLLLVLFATSVDSFVVRSPSSPALAASTTFSSSFKTTSTCLRAEDEKETAEETTAAGESVATATDILNSPGFMKRKIDVLKSDIAAADEEIAAAKKLVEEGKAEWGSQLDSLQSEVRIL